MFASPWRLLTGGLLVTAAISGVVGAGCTSFGAADSPEADGAVASDGRSDAGAAADAAFCASLDPKPTFCDDFERSMPLGSWAAREVSNGGAVEIKTATLTSAGHALNVAIPLVTGRDLPFARLKRPFAHAAEIDLRFAIRIDELPTQGAIEVCAIGVQPNQTEAFTAFFMVRPAGITYVEQKFPYTGNQDYAEQLLAQPITLGAPHVIVVHLSLAVSPPHATVRVDDAVAWDGPSLGAFKPGTPTVVAGIDYAEPPVGPLSVFIDDVTVTIK